MRSVYFEEMDMFWDRYAKKINAIGYVSFLETDEKQLQKFLRVSYKELLQEIVTDVHCQKGEPQIKYSLLKLRRLIALWTAKNVMCGPYIVSYRPNDERKEFPCYSGQSFNIYPTVSTIKGIKVKIIKDLIDDYNAYVDEIRAKGRTDHAYIRNLKDLRTFFMSRMEIPQEVATRLVDIYREGSAKKEVVDFSEIVSIDK